MKILYIPHAYPPVIGGTEILCQRICETLKRKGHDVSVLTGNIESIEDYYCFTPIEASTKSQTINGVPVVRLLYGTKWQKALQKKLLTGPQNLVMTRISGAIGQQVYKHFMASLKREIVKSRPDVVVTMPHLVTNVQAVLEIKNNLRFPLVMLPLIHADWSTSTNIAMKAGLHQADAVIAVTKHEAELLVDSFDVAPEKVFLSWIGTDIPITIPATKTKCVLFIGRKVQSKGILLLLQAMKMIWLKMPDVDLILAGARTAYSEEIEKQVRQLSMDMQERVHSLDDISDDHKSSLLSSASCLVLPSSSESFGIVLIEAMAHETPVIAFRQPVFESIVEDNVDGFLVNPNDAAEMARAICAVLSNPDVAKKMGKAGRDKVSRTFTWDAVADVHLAACRHAVSSRSKRQRNV